MTDNTKLSAEYSLTEEGSFADRHIREALAAGETRQETEWNVWGLFPDNTWRRISRAFETERDAEIWALRLGMEHRTEEEDTD